MKIVITGGIGFIGTNTALYFSKNPNNKIVLVDNYSRKGVENNAKFLKAKYPNIKIIKTDAKDINNYKNDLNTADVVIHLAGQTAVTTSIIRPDHDFKNNLIDSFTLLDHLRKIKSKAVIIYSSTNKVYGDLSHIKNSDYQPVDENEKLDFISPYGCSKGSSDLYFLDYARIFKLNTVVFRQSCIYGPNQIGVEDQGWVAHFSKQFLFRKPITIFGDGHQVRDLLYVEDLVEAYDKAIKNINKVKGQALNIGGGIKNAYSLLQVINMLEKELGYKIKISYKQIRVGDQKYFVSKNAKIKKLLGWKSTTDFKKGLIKLINWQKNNLQKLK